MTDQPNEEPVLATDDEEAAEITTPAFGTEIPADEIPADEMPADDELETVDLEFGDEEATAEAPVAEAKTIYRGSGIRWGFVAGLVLAVLLVILVFQNTDPVSFRFLIWEIETPLAALLIATAVIAAVADELVGVVVRARRRRRLAEKDELEKLRQQGHQ